MAIRQSSGKNDRDERSSKEQVAELEERLEKVRVDFEKYFLGIDKRPPLDARADVQRTLRLMQNKRIQQTVVRFQFQGLIGRFNVLDSYWTRILRQIEEGTYARDLFKAKLKQSPPLGAEALKAAESQKAAEALKAAEAQKVADAQKAAPRPGAPHELVSEDRLQRVYQDFIDARRFCGEPVEGLAYERIRDKLLAEAPKIAEKTHSSRVDFQVVIRDGRAVLKAVPVREG